MSLRFIPDIHRATHRIGLYLERAADLGVTQGEAHILAHLGSSGDSTVAELHRAFAHKRSTLTSILDRLAARGLVVRESHAADRRTFLVSLTAEGEALAARVLEHLEALEARVLEHASPRQLQGFAAVLKVLERLAEKEE